MRTLIIIIGCVFIISIFGTCIYKNVTLRQNCTGYLKRAADANTVETAKSQLEKAISYMETHNLTNGYTSVLWKTPDEDIEFWYNNIKSSYNELCKVTPETSSLEKTNMLMKLRETLLDSGSKGDSLTYPHGLSKYPDNVFWAIMNSLAILALIVLVIYVAVIID
jgi:hypothetical protein